MAGPSQPPPFPPGASTPRTDPPTASGAASPSDDPAESEFSPRGWSRREFIKSVIASGVVVSGAGFFPAGCARPVSGTQGSIERLLSLSVNGQIRRVDVLPNETLAMTLRYKLGLTGTKLACDRAECGSCTVLVDDVAHYACSTLTHRVRDRAVTTVEGLESADGTLHPVQQAFVDELAPQCGFCTPGQVMSAVALLRENPSPTRDEARSAMAGNLCRCGAYDHYLNGVMRAAQVGQTLASRQDGA